MVHLGIRNGLPPETFKLRKSRKLWVHHCQTGKDIDMTAFAKRDFDVLLRDCRVRGIDVTDELISVITKVSMEVTHQGQRNIWYLGEYFIVLHPQRLGFEVRCVESGRHDEAKRHLYTQNSESFPGGFCFGGRNERVHELVKQREYFALIMLVLDSLWHVNDDGIFILVTQYRKYLDDGRLEPIRKCKPGEPEG